MLQYGKCPLHTVQLSSYYHVKINLNEWDQKVLGSPLGSSLPLDIVINPSLEQMLQNTIFLSSRTGNTPFICINITKCLIPS